MKFLYAFIIILLLKIIWVFGLTSKVTVIKVIDGDTFVAKDLIGRELRIRLRNIDAPEMGQTDKLGIKDQGEASKSFLKGLIEGKKVSLKNKSVDIYQRILAQVLLEKTDINLQLLKSGNALIYQKPKDKRLKALYTQAQVFAKQNGKGFWYYGGITHPKTFRKKWRKKTRKASPIRYNI